MKINIKATGLELTPSLRGYIEGKLGALTKLIPRFASEGIAEMWVEVARTTRHHHKGLVFYAEADLRLPKKVLRAEHYDTDVRAAIDKLKIKLRQEIERYKTRMGPKTAERKK